MTEKITTYQEKTVIKFETIKTVCNAYFDRMNNVREQGSRISRVFKKNNNLKIKIIQTKEIMRSTELI